MVLGCGGHNPQVVSSSDSAAQVVIIGNGHSCDGGLDNSMRSITEEDAKKVSHVFSSPVLLVDSADRSVELSAARSALSNSDGKRGLFLFYSGHGRLGKNNDHELCLQSDRSHTVTLPDIIKDRNPGWMVAVVNSCYSGHTDISNLSFDASVISVAHEKISSLLRKDIDENGSIIGRILVSILSGDNTDVKLDLNCDGIITDQELFDALRKASGTDPAILSVVNPPKLNIRRDGATHLPIVSLLSKPSPHCRNRNIKGEMRALESALDLADGKAVHDVIRLIDGQLSLIEKLKNRETDQVAIIPRQSKDFFIVSPDDDAIREKALNADLTSFPGDLERARHFAEFTIAAEVYHLQPDDKGRFVRIYRLRDQRLMRTIYFNRNQNGNRAHGLLERTLKNLSERIAVAAKTDDGKVWVRFLKNIPEKDISIYVSNDEVAEFKRTDATPVPCDGEDGQCFVLEKIQP